MTRLLENETESHFLQSKHMLQAFVITLREGLEAFLIIAISLAYLRKSHRSELIPAVHWGIATSALLSIAAGWLFYQARNQALWEGVLALAAAVSVASLTIHMWRTAKRIKKDIEGHLHTSSMKSGSRGICRRLPVHVADDHARRHGNGAADGHARCFQMKGRSTWSLGAVGGMALAAFRRVALVAVSAIVSTWRCSSRSPPSSSWSSSFSF